MLLIVVIFPATTPEPEGDCALLPPDRDQPRDDHDEVDLPRERLHHRAERPRIGLRDEDPGAPRHGDRRGREIRRGGVRRAARELDHRPRPLPGRALEPERAARSALASGVAKRYDYARQTMQDVPYGLWREYDPEDTIRFYALRLHEVGMIQSTPQTIIENGTDWSFFLDLKKTLKA